MADQTLVTEQQLKQAFYQQVICTQTTKRFVAKADVLGSSDTGESCPMQIFIPNGPEDDYDLVLSLCKDGTQRVTVDWDAKDTLPSHALRSYNETCRPTRIDFSYRRVTHVTPSTSNWALWGDVEVSWKTVTDVLAAVDNPGYLAMNKDRGFCSLRPPWKNKGDMTFHDMIGFRFNRPPDRDMFAGVDWSRVPAPEPVPQGTGWEDIFGDEQ